MSHVILLFKKIESLNSKELADALEFNGYGECVAPIRSKNIDGEQFLKLTEVQISLWRLPMTQSRRLWSFIQQIKLDPTQMLLDVHKKSRDRITTVKKININQIKFSSIKDNDEQSCKVSSLTKQESSLFKSKLEEMFKKESEEIPNTSFVHHHKYPRLPPKPDHLKTATDLIIDNELKDPVDDYDGYLSPIKIEPKSIDHIFEDNRSTFLSKYKRASEGFEKRTNQIIRENKPIIKTRPLPPIPALKLTSNNTPSTPDESDNDDEIGHYTPILQDAATGRPLPETEELPEYTPVEDSDEKITVLSSKRPLPPIPTIEHDELPEYTPVEDTDENFSVLPVKRPLPPIPIVNHKELPDHTNGEYNNENMSIHVTVVPSKRPLPPIPIPKQLPEYTPVLEENNMKEASMQSTVFRNPPPPELCSSHNNSIKRNVKPTIPPILNKEILNQHEKKLPSDARPKLFMKLPKPPVDLPLQSLPLFNPEESVTEKLEDVTFASNLENEHHRSHNKDEEIDDDDLRNAPCYRETDRKGARLLLTGLDDGAFIIRPSRQDKYVCTLSIMHTKKMFNIGIERDADGTLIFGSSSDNLDHPIFYAIDDVVKYYSINPIQLYSEYILLKNILPPNKH